MDANNAKLSAVLADADILIDNDKWFGLLQDEGRDMTPEEETQFMGDGEKKRKTKAWNILYASRFYPKLYQLSELIYEKIFARRDKYFQLLPAEKNSKTNTIHQIGFIIASNCGVRPIRQHELNATTNGGFDLLIEQSTREEFFIFTQPSLLAILVNRYAQNEMKITTNDKVRMAGILLNNDIVRDSLQYLTGKSLDSDNRLEIDRSAPEKAAALKMILNKFIDKEVVITIPDKWLNPQTELNIDATMGDGMYEMYGTYDPNSLERMTLPWTVKDIMNIIKMVIKEYNEMMVKYTKGTGGGPGAEEHFATWEERNEYHCASYTSQPVNMYLSVVHIWDKLYDFPLHKMTAKGTLPVESAIDEFYNPDGSGIEDGMMKPANHGKSSSVRAEDSMMKVLNTLGNADSTSSSLSHSVEATSREMLDIMHGLTNSPEQNHELKPHEIIGNISNNTQMINSMRIFLLDINCQRGKLRTEITVMTRERIKS